MNNDALRDNNDMKHLSVSEYTISHLKHIEESGGTAVDFKIPEYVRLK